MVRPKFSRSYCFRMKHGLGILLILMPVITPKVIVTKFTRKYEDNPTNCSKLKDFASDGAGKEISSALAVISPASTAWLPLRRIWFNSWTWMDGSIYATTISNPSDVVPGEDCAWLRAGDMIIDDGPCNRMLPLIVCDTKGNTCSSQKEGYKCFTYNNKTYIIFSEKQRSWFMAKQHCYEKNLTLASFPSKDLDTIMKRLKLELGSYEKVWIGLRKGEYIDETQNNENSFANKFEWATKMPCVCPDKKCVIVNNTRWQAENCSSRHHFLCLESSTEMYIAATTPAQRKKTVNVGAVVGGLFGVIVVTAVVVAAILLWRKGVAFTTCIRNIFRKSPQEQDEDVLKQLTELPPLTQSAVHIRNDILRPNKPKKANPNILLIGQPGTGKSSLINSLIAALDKEGYHEWRKTGSYGKHGQAGKSAITQRLKSFRLFQNLEREKGMHDELKYECRPTLWDCPGLMDDESERTKAILRLLLNGAIKNKELINKLLEMNEDKFHNYGFVPDLDRKIDIILLVHAADSTVTPENLMNSVEKMAGDDEEGESVPIILVINKKDKVSKEEQEKLKLDVGKTIGLHDVESRVAVVSSYSKDTTKGVKRTEEIDLDMCLLWDKILNPAFYLQE